MKTRLEMPVIRGQGFIIELVAETQAERCALADMDGHYEFLEPIKVREGECEQVSVVVRPKRAKAS